MKYKGYFYGKIETMFYFPTNANVRMNYKTRRICFIFLHDVVGIVVESDIGNS